MDRGPGKEGIMKTMQRWAVGLVLATAGAAGAAEFEVTGLASPESFVVDPATGCYFISNIDGKGDEKDGKGFLTKLDPDGKVIALKFADSTAENPLHAPKGLAVVGKTVWAADIDHVRGYDAETGKPAGDFDLTAQKAVFLNDLAADGSGHLYVTDMRAKFVAMITIEGGKIEILASGDHLASPNGVTIHPKRRCPIVASWDVGKVIELLPDNQSKVLYEAPLKNLDGVEFDAEGTLYVSSWTGGKVFTAKEKGEVTVLHEGMTSPADIGLDLKKRLLLIPFMKENRAKAVELK